MAAVRMTSSIDSFKVGESEKKINALLADLQNSVPGHQHNMSSSTTTTQHVQQNYGGTPGYGSLRGKPSPQSPTYQQHIVETKTSTSPAFNGINSGGQNQHHNYSTSSTNQSSSSSYYNQGSLPRQTTQTHTHHIQQQQQHHQHQPQQHHQQQQQQRSSTPQNNAGNLSELDSLLQDLSNAKYNNSFDKKEHAVPTNYNGKVINQQQTITNYNTISESNKRPSVDSLLDELSTASANQIYAVPNGVSPTVIGIPPKRHVTITVRETTTEKVAGPEGIPVSGISEQLIQQKDSYTSRGEQQPSIYASSATKELDDLMASLSDFKVNSSSHHHQTVTDYAKPNKGISHNNSGYQTVTQIEETIIREEETDDNYRQSDQLDSMLGNLQANMSRQGVNTVQKGCCNACEKPIVGQVITALGKTWHPEHFTCNHCNQELGTRNFFERDGFPYCEPDYHNLFSPRCAYCNGAILDKCVTALDKTWHTEHFFCAQCGQQFGEDGFHERDGKPYCRNDYFEMFAPKCNGCNRAIMENYISALNSQWHPDCFVCRDCKKAVKGKSFYAMEGKPVCPPCAGVDEEE